MNIALKSQKSIQSELQSSGYSSEPDPIPDSYAFVFVCQQGELEGLSLLLAASLKRFLQCKYELIAAVPMPCKKWGTLDSVTDDLFARMNIRVEYFENPIERDQIGNALTNKIYCFDVPTAMDKLVFLDSDLLCLRSFHGHHRFAMPFNAAPTFLATGRNWEAIYQSVGLQLPREQMNPLFSDEWQPPYFNSGFVAVRRSLAKELASVWRDCFATITACGVMNDNLYFREQVSLSLALQKMGLRYDVLDKSYNFWVKAHPLQVDDLPYFLHHTWPNPPVYHQPFLIDLVRSLVRDYPEMEPFVAQTRWKYYLRPTWLTALNCQLFNHRLMLKQLLGETWSQALVRA
ncbi:MAG: hypothetical protein VKL39_21165 [Leptolyngbyaceae bacterium]|nr:hypothetical protein [Leptolyngbyaceae bacterium]